MIKKRHEHLDILINNAGIYVKPDTSIFYEQVAL
jgi:short-subunit dehydrogenase involved in D-alanine esterification of teichoic acids